MLALRRRRLAPRRVLPGGHERGLGRTHGLLAGSQITCLFGQVILEGPELQRLGERRLFVPGELLCAGLELRLAARQLGRAGLELPRALGERRVTALRRGLRLADRGLPRRQRLSPEEQLRVESPQTLVLDGERRLPPRDRLLPPAELGRLARERLLARADLVARSVERGAPLFDGALHLYERLLAPSERGLSLDERGLPRGGGRLHVGARPLEALSLGFEVELHLLNRTLSFRQRALERGDLRLAACNRERERPGAGIVPGDLCRVGLGERDEHALVVVDRLGRG
ncbi:MAG: hypothetical protein H6710_18480 [Myxococcales bacterium]|nr:hypothetical protein [Myxococcales bacterium]